MISNSLGTKITKEIQAKINPKDNLAFLATVDSSGIPNLTTIPFYMIKDEESLLFAIHKDNSAYRNLIKSKKVIFSIYDENDTCLHIFGRAGVVSAPSDTHPMMNIVRIDVINIKGDTSAYLSIVSGVRVKYKDDKAKRFKTAMLSELKKVANQL
ncbi:MAG: hypothetical protein A3C43_12330 [Candidatus Schekmanbacteria bacterium RIFCSPHIGHO2_02_FULL_38_11]|uniref:Pyridoxamine 5'-phosphate oxidase N-terminal domain-containing protein n=1 Tax=Candidatus Schekmanbacteria bacterium RIFCSPLOWO2_12_FULL_38_15 TaxID=1817883 RepID=A0A1F7SHU6_9BACT|nr:MAG: hypothetical protein A2043_00545 [Candidatus Schekmanbacteria bacterium GWA2_38_9]OGL50867.1 MAG: hypothetical protein A3H37_03395 [Candidatus Schekmanbacteria bacterium RIFCSPLOWO2_02_FULL_38_14]OGL53373.1 MAG: hypothetical protein A3G31_07670 [Candidatus Schekmanbacteria bacterium RIFCSPLOWO2_12_FULL_38_15]OGL55727.1 MAG: hypothetical protein A3C43_12330 [Candidatus Schekmanbacteria bacterium RIFCSPHIGHO2_02_FULL_38_11]